MDSVTEIRVSTDGRYELNDLKPDEIRDAAATGLGHRLGNVLAVMGNLQFYKTAEAELLRQNFLMVDPQQNKTEIFKMELNQGMTKEDVARKVCQIFLRNVADKARESGIPGNTDEEVIESWRGHINNEWELVKIKERDESQESIEIAKGKIMRIMDDVVGVANGKKGLPPIYDYSTRGKFFDYGNFGPHGTNLG